MKESRVGFFLLCAVMVAGMAVSAIGCMGLGGTMDGSLSANIGDQPIWGPTGYDRAQYYYIPDIDAYYSVSERQYIYRDGSGWKHDASYPSSYSGYDPYRSYKVVLNENQPYNNHDSHQAKYRNFRGMKDQPVIRDSRDSRYFVNKDHPEHDNWVRKHTN